VIIASVVNRRLPFMLSRTLPPYFFVGPRRYIHGSQAAVQRRMPLACQIGINRLQAVFSINLLISAVRTTLSVAPVAHCRHPFMPFRTFPPYFLIGKGLTSRGVRLPLDVECHSQASLGLKIRRLFSVSILFPDFPMKPPHDKYSSG